MKILLLGTMPPPIGGVTVHVERFLYYSRKKNLNIAYYDLRKNKRNIVRYLIGLYMNSRKFSGDIVHYQLNNWYEALPVRILFRRCAMIYTVHSFPQDVQHFNIIKKGCFKYLVRTIDCFVAPSETIRSALIRNGVAPNKISVINTYLPPTEREKSCEIDPKLMDELNCGKKIILASASKIYKTNGIDLYGLDLCIEACRVMGNKYKFIFCYSGEGDKDYINECKSCIADYGIQDRFFLYKGNAALSSIYKYCDLFVRPTNSDSYGISVAEALDCGIPALASDVCERAEGAVLFRNRDLDSFVNGIKNTITTKQNTSNKIVHCLDKIISLYKEVDTNGNKNLQVER